MKTAAQIIEAQNWKAASGQVVDAEGQHVARMRRERMDDGHGDYMRPPHHTDALTYLLAASPAMFKALSNVVQNAGCDKDSYAFRESIKDAEKALAQATAWDKI